MDAGRMPDAMPNAKGSSNSWSKFHGGDACETVASNVEGTPATLTSSDDPYEIAKA
jgi:hypothetical protein